MTRSSVYSGLREYLQAIIVALGIRLTQGRRTFPGIYISFPLRFQFLFGSLLRPSNRSSHSPPPPPLPDSHSLLHPRPFPGFFSFFFSIIPPSCFHVWPRSIDRSIVHRVFSSHPHLGDPLLIVIHHARSSSTTPSRAPQCAAKSCYFPFKGEQEQ